MTAMYISVKEKWMMIYAVGFNVLGKERDYMLIPMFYGSIDSNGKMRSIAGQLQLMIW